MQGEMGFTLSDGLALADADLEDLWCRYAALGGHADAATVGKFITGAVPCGDVEHDLIAQALNEIFFDRGMCTFPVSYSGRIRRVPAQVRAERRGRAGTTGSAAWERALEARRVSHLTARRAAELHLAAAQLMYTSGQLRFANRAMGRAAASLARVAAADVLAGQPTRRPA